VKGLDTPVLLTILHDSPSAKELLRSLRGEELATTELNMFELRTLAAEGPRAQRIGRETALARLRRRITVLSITADAVQGAGRFYKGNHRATNYQPLVWAALAAAGCGEWITTRKYAPAKGTLPFKLRVVQ
jgi:predicted nucleic acid-binding protein